jgi:hypothetical protein
MGARQETVCERVIHAVAASDDSDPVELPTLHGVIDPDALETCVNRLEWGKISFQYAGYTVTVDAEGAVTVADSTDDAREQIDVATD